FGRDAPAPAAPAVAREVAPEHHGIRGLAVIPDDHHPRREVGVLSYRGPAARAIVAVRRAELAQGAAEVERPLVMEGGVRVGIERPLLRQPRGRPVLPPVEVPAEQRVELRRAAIVPSRPGRPHLLVRALQIAEIVDLESGGAALVVGLEIEVLAAHLAELNRLEVARQTRARGIEAKRVRTLVVMRRALLRTGNRLGRTSHATQVDRARQLVAPAGEAMAEIQSARVRALVLVGRAPGVTLTIHRRDDAAHARFALAQVLAQPHHAV